MIRFAGTLALVVAAVTFAAVGGWKAGAALDRWARGP